MNPQQPCFLCVPDPALVYASDGNHIALCGLGPIVEGYSLVATRAHVRSWADAGDGLAFVETIRNVLNQRYGSCLLTEHGRMPLCGSRPGDGHCYHAHFLLFPAVPDISQKVRPYFFRADTLGSLADALGAAKQMEEYFLFSPSEDEYLLMSRPGRLIRQFARLMVAESVGEPEKASWVRYPEYNKATVAATELRRLVTNPLRFTWTKQN